MPPSTSPLFAGPAHVGRLCPGCSQPIELHQLIQIDPVGGAPHHQRCWESVLEHRPPAAGPQGAGGGDQPAADTPTAEVPRLNRAKILLMVLCVLVGILGPMLGIVIGFLWTDPQAPAPRRRDGRELMIFASVLFAVHLLGVFFGAVNLAHLLTDGTSGPPFLPRFW